MNYITKSYNPGACCGADCTYDYLSTEDKPCWGDVEVVGDEGDGDSWTWLHACRGHKDVYDEMDYTLYSYEAND